MSTLDAMGPRNIMPNLPDRLGIDAELGGIPSHCHLSGFNFRYGDFIELGIGSSASAPSKSMLLSVLGIIHPCSIAQIARKVIESVTITVQYKRSIERRRSDEYQRYQSMHQSGLMLPIYRQSNHLITTIQNPRIQFMWNRQLPSLLVAPNAAKFIGGIIREVGNWFQLRHSVLILPSIGG